MGTRSDASRPDQLYFDWLYRKVAVLSDRNPQRSHWLLCEQLHKTPFTWSVPNDDNRAADGLFLHEQFENETGYIYEGGMCSVLEMLIALAQRASIEMDGVSNCQGTDEWFWMMLANLDIDQYTDDSYFEADAEGIVEEVVEQFLARDYSRDGEGGLFPLLHPHQDQRKVEIWYQMHAYLLENN